MPFHQRRPGPPLDAFVDSVWLCRFEPRARRLECVVPGGGAQVIINLAEDETRVYEDSPRGLLCRRSPGSIVTGLTTRYQIIDTAEQEYVAGIAFKPGGTLPFVESPAHDLSDDDVPLEALWGRQQTSLLRERLLAAPDAETALDVLEQVLRETWCDRTPHPAVAFALGEFRADPSATRVGDVTGAIGLSAKRFIERFKAEVGVTPKRYCRLLRFQRAVALAHRGLMVDWRDLAIACGYFDQAHLIHEFREFSGMTPTRYEAGRTSFQNHVTFLQSTAD